MSYQALEGRENEGGEMWTREYLRGGIQGKAGRGEAITGKGGEGGRMGEKRDDRRNRRGWMGRGDARGHQEIGGERGDRWGGGGGL